MRIHECEENEYKNEITQEKEDHVWMLFVEGSGIPISYCPFCGKNLNKKREQVKVVNDRIIFEADEGRYVDICCMICHKHGEHSERGVLDMAFPVRMYISAICCLNCGEQLQEFDILQ